MEPTKRLTTEERLTFAIKALGSVSDWISYTIEVDQKEYYLFEILRILKTGVLNET